MRRTSVKHSQDKATYPKESNNSKRELEDTLAQDGQIRND
jgi:hypothetical protein